MLLRNIDKRKKLLIGKKKTKVVFRDFFAKNLYYLGVFMDKNDKNKQCEKQIKKDINNPQQDQKNKQNNTCCKIKEGPKNNIKK